MSNLPNIGLMGKARAGKNAVAEHLVREHGYQQVAFADALRELCREIDPVVSGMVGPVGTPQIRYQTAEHLHGYEASKDYFPEFRRTLQHVGVAVRKVLGERTWIAAVAGRLDELSQAGTPWVVTDVRFLNEYVALDWRAEIVRVERPDLPVDPNAHISETELDNQPADLTIVNDGTLTGLHAKVDLAVAFLRRAVEPMPALPTY